MNKVIFFVFGFCFIFGVRAQDDLSVSIQTKGIFSSDAQNPFWLYANQRGRVDQKTNFNALAQLSYSYAFNEDSSLELSGGLLYKDGLWEDVFVDELYASYSYKKLQIDLGVKQRPEKYYGLSSVGGDVLWSNNAMAMPGLHIQITEPIKIFNWMYTKGQIAHYEQNDERFVDGTKVHFKSFYLDLRLTPRDIISGKLQHYVQWGGTSPTYGEYPEGFSDFVDVFLGRAGDENASQPDQLNAVGNHLGSYEFNYRRSGARYDFTFYHQSIFEDSSGRNLNNFPDGVWGLFFDFHESEILKGLNFEYVQTVSQSGRYATTPGLNGYFKGGDNYFIGNQYASGWTYRNQIIGMPFIFKEEDGHPYTNSRSYAFHAGATGHFWELDYKAKLTFVENLGTYGTPVDPHEKAIYTYGQLIYPTTSYGNFSLEAGLDHSNLRNTTAGLSLGYTYSF